MTNLKVLNSLQNTRNFQNAPIILTPCCSQGWWPSGTYRLSRGKLGFESRSERTFIFSFSMVYCSGFELLLGHGVVGLRVFNPLTNRFSRMNERNFAFSDHRV